MVRHLQTNSFNLRLHHRCFFHRFISQWSNSRHALHADFYGGVLSHFSFFKMLNLSGFAESYVMYDVIAKRIPIWAYLYAFIELALGIAYAVNFNPLITNATTFIVMSVSIIGVLQSVLNKKRKFNALVWGAVFNLPMSTVTIIEDALMIAMSGIMLIQII